MVFALLASEAAAQERVAGYLPEGVLAEAVLIPPPPPAGSAEAAADEALWRASEAGADGAAWRRAAADDAAMSGPAPALLFACALGARLDATAAPALNQMLRRVAVDAGNAAERLKAVFRRPRPFANQPTARLCVAVPPERRPTASPTYPSGSATLGTAWSLVLAEVAPERAGAILARGREIGEGRLACRMHYLSDVVAGRDVAAAVVARLHGEAAFRADVEAARARHATGRGRAPPAEGC